MKTKRKESNTGTGVAGDPADWGAALELGTGVPVGAGCGGVGTGCGCGVGRGEPLPGRGGDQG
jgi:hypothetical protein